MKVELITDLESFASLREPWNRLAGSRALLSWDWLFAWWEELGQGELAIVKVSNQGKLVALAPFFVASNYGEHQLRFLGTGETCTDYIDLLWDPESCQQGAASEVVGEIFDLLSSLRERSGGRLPNVSLVELEGVLATDVEATKIELLRRSFWMYEKNIESTWILELAGSWSDFVAGCPRGLRRKVRKAEKRLNSDEFAVSSVSSADKFDAAFDELVELHQLRRNELGEPGIFSDSRVERFLRTASRRLFDRDLAQIFTCSRNGEAIITQLHVRGDSGWQFYQSGTLPTAMKWEPGFLLFSHVIHEAIDRGDRTLDFLRGDEPYKEFWGATRQPLQKLRFVSPAWSATFRHRMVQRLTSMKQWWQHRNSLPHSPAESNLVEERHAAEGSLVNR